MTENRVQDVVNEATEFIKKAKLVLERIDKVRLTYREVAICHQSSIDLGRILVEMCRVG